MEFLFDFIISKCLYLRASRCPISTNNILPRRNIYVLHKSFRSQYRAELLNNSKQFLRRHATFPIRYFSKCCEYDTLKFLYAKPFNFEATKNINCRCPAIEVLISFNCHCHENRRTFVDSIIIIHVNGLFICARKYIHT